jgi:DnaJ-class molecular chaperone
VKKDYYEILGITKGSTAADIKSAYRKKALEWHPDRNKSADAEEKFKEINEAYEILSNDQKRSAYDQYGHAAFDPSAGGFGNHTYTQGSGPFTFTWNSNGPNFGQNADFDFGGFSNPFDIFEQFFGGGGGFGGRQTRQIPTYRIVVEFMEAVNGVEKEISLDGNKKKIKIPAGVDDGQRIKYGDFILYIDVKPDLTFKRDGNDVYISQEITFAQAALGDEISIQTLEGPLSIRVRPGTQSHTLIRLKAKGIKDVNGYGRGDFYIRLLITVPTRLSAAQKELLRQLNL